MPLRPPHSRAPLLPPVAAAGDPPLVAVTGGAGFVGSHLTEALLQRGYRVRVVDDLSTGRLDNLQAVHGAAGLELVVASVAETAVAARAVAAADFVFHLAGAAGVRWLAREPLRVMQANLRCTEELLAAASAAGVPVLLASSSEVYGDGPAPFHESDPLRPGSPEGLRGGYACAKAMGEWLAFGHAAQHGLPVVVARLFNTVGPRQRAEHGMVLPRFLEQALRGEPITVYGDGAQSRCFAHVREVVQALLALAAAPAVAGRVFNVGSQVETRVEHLAELVRAATGSRSPIVRLPLSEIFPVGFPDPVRRVPALEQLRQAIGWVPAAPLRQIIADVLAAMPPALAGIPPAEHAAAPAGSGGR